MILNKPFIIYFVSFFLSFFIFNQLYLPPDLKSTATNKFFPADYEMLKRTFPYYDYDKSAYKIAVDELKILMETKKIEKKNSQGVEFIGPTNIGGRVVDIEFNPKSPNIVYAAAATGGVFKSTDTGESWFPIFDNQSTLTIGDIGIDPTNPEIIYVGTGEANGGHNNFPGMGIFKSIDAGSTWNFIGLDSSVSIGRIIIDQTNSDRIFVAAVGSYFAPNKQRGVFLSEDGGLTWKNSLFVSDSTGAIDLVMDPTNSNILYAAMWERVRPPIFRSGTHLHGPSGGIFKTIDGGKNWTKLGPQNGLPDPEINQIGRIGISISKTDHNTLYATYNDESIMYGIYKTTDGGNNWVETNNSFPGTSNFSWYFGQVRVHPSNPNTVFVLDVSFMKSTSSGYNWEYTSGYSNIEELYVDNHALAFHPNNPEYIICGNDGGIFISENGGLNWNKSGLLPISQFYEIGLDRNNPESFYGGTQDNNTIRTLTGSEDDWERIYGGDGFYVIVDPNNSNIVYAESQFGDLGKSTNGGKNFSWALNGIDGNEPTNWSTPIAIDPNNSDVLYYGTHSLYRTKNAAGSWEKISPQLTDFEEGRRLGTITTISIAPTNSNVIYVGTDDGNVWITSDYGSSWSNISDNLPFRWVTRVLADPNDENIVYVTFSGLRWADPEPRVFRSVDKGESWNDISKGLPDAPMNAIAVNPNNSSNIYLGSDVGVFVSFDEGNNWEVLDNNFPIVIVNDLKIHTVADFLAIGTHGRGMYKYDLSNVSHYENNSSSIPIKLVLEQNYPNPFNPTTRITYSIPEQTYVSVKVYDVLGKEVQNLVGANKNAGSYEVLFDASNISSGIYYYRIEVGKYAETKKMIVMK